ncbi:tetratricopeptide repeat protein 4 isoform X2 [Cimex lectularius]|nr:tetratricopeptide repeat protein 4 isoform X2 [Cimex lectularius]
MPGDIDIDTSENVIRLEAEKEEDAYEKPKKTWDNEEKVVNRDGEVSCRQDELQKCFLDKLKIDGKYDVKAVEEMSKEKKTWTDEERTMLQEQLDKEFDDFIKGLETRKQSEAWPEEKWEEEMEKHPFFMKNTPENGELPPLLEGLCQLKYSSSENTPEELANAFKDDGNFNFKCKNYRMAVISYTEGISKKCSNARLNAQLYNNRAAAQFYLKNYRSCFYDCKRALECQPHYPKASLRLAHVSLLLGEFDECLKECEILLSSDPTNKEYKNIQEQAAKSKKIKERNDRKEFVKSKKAELDKKILEKAIKERGIKMLNTETANIVNNLFSDVAKKGVHLDDDKRIIWPVILLYPEYRMSDIIECFHEDTTFEEQFQEVFAEVPEWDLKGVYRPGALNIYYEDANNAIHQVHPADTLGSVLSRESYYIDAATPSFIVMPKDSEADTKFLEGQFSSFQ